MSDICTIKKSTLDGIAEAIQSKTGESSGMLPSEMQGKIEDLPSQPAKGLVFSEYDSDGYPHKAEFVGFVGSLPTNYGRALFELGRFGKYITELVWDENLTDLGSINENNALQKIVLHSGVTGVSADAVYGDTSLVDVNLEDTSIRVISSSGFFNTRMPKIKIPTTITRIRVNGFSQNPSLTEVYFLGDVVNIEQNVFSGCNAVTLYDFSNHSSTIIPSLYSVASLGHANGCVIKVPQSLLSTWQNETNWSALTDVVWQGV